jgi:TonB-dependent receptor
MEGLHMRRFLGLLLAVVCSLVLNSPVSAQSGKGTVVGTVRDSGNSALQGALVELLPLGRKAVSDSQGQFRIMDVPVGEYTLSVSYVGLAVSNVPVTVSAGQEASANAVLQVASQVDQVVVSAEQLQGEAEAINIERTAENIVQVLPERVITSLPNTNIADAVGRLPSVSLERDEGEGKYVQIRGTEPRLSSVTINGVNVPSPETAVRNIKLDAVPSDLVERIEVFKTLSADQDADGIGGTVNLVTRSAGEKPTYAIGGTGGYNPIQGGLPRGGFDGTFGQRFFASKKLAFLLSGTFDRTNRGINDNEPAESPATFNGKNLAYTSASDFRTYNYYRTRYGFSGSVDYNLKPGSSIYLKGLYADFHDFGETWVYTANAGSITAVNGSQVTLDNTGNFVYRHYIRRPDQQIFSISTGGRHDIGKNLITYEVAGSRSHNIGGQDFPTTNFSPIANSPLNNIAFLQDSTNPFRPKFVPLNLANNASVFDPTQYQIVKTDLPSYSATQVNFQGAASASRRYSLHSHFGTFEVGLKIRNSHSMQHENDKFYNFTGNTPITLSSVLGTFTNPGYYEGAYAFGGMNYGPTSSYNKIQQSFASNMSQFQFDPVASLRQSERAFFDAGERIYAGYVQNAISFGKFRLQTGVRFDKANANFTTNQLDVTNPALPVITPIHQSAGYFNALPSVQLQYQLEKNTNLRGNYSIGISRPNIGDLVPTTVVDPNTSPRGTVQLGNSNLKPTKANNFDLLVEHFFQPLGILQAGFFYKRLSNPIYATTTIIPAGQPNAGFFLNQSINGPNAHIAGFEAAWEQRFSFLPSFLNGFGVAANYSYTTSQATFPTGFNGSRIDQPRLQRQAPNNWNAGLTYDKARFSMRFAVSHNDTSIFQYAYQHVDAATDKDPFFGLKGPSGDIYLYAHTQFDIQGSYRIAKGLHLQVSGLNLTNEVFGFYQGSGIYPIQREFYKPTVSFGVRWTSSPE